MYREFKNKFAERSDAKLIVDLLSRPSFFRLCMEE